MPWLRKLFVSGDGTAHAFLCDRHAEQRLDAPLDPLDPPGAYPWEMEDLDLRLAPFMHNFGCEHPACDDTNIRHAEAVAAEARGEVYDGR